MAKKKSARKPRQIKSISGEEEKTISKKDAVLAYIAAHPGCKNTEVVEGLKAQGITITPNYVSICKVGGKKAADKKAAAKKAQSETMYSVSLPDIQKAIAIVEKLGGLEQAKEFVTKLISLNKML